MGRSLECRRFAKDYRRFAGECLQMAQRAEDKQNRAIFLQMAQAWFALAEREEAGSDNIKD
jgi:hypothetical protein